MRNDTETDLSEAQRRDLSLIAGIMVPASEEFAVPGADDAAIFDDILRSLGRDRASVRDALTRLAAQAGGALAALDDARRQTVADAFLASDAPEVAIGARPTTAPVEGLRTSKCSLVATLALSMMSWN